MKDRRKPSSRRLGILLLFALIALGLLFFAAYSRRNTRSRVTLDSPVLIETARPSRHNFSVRIPWYGKVVATNRIEITARVDGEILAQRVPDERRVRAGESLFLIGGTQLITRRKVLEEKQEFLGRQISIAEADAGKYREALKEKLVSRREALAALDNLNRLRLELSRTQQELSLLDDAASVPAPVSGIFTSRTVSRGQFVNTGAHLADIIDSRGIRILATVFSPSGDVFLGKKATCRVPGKAFEISARVIRVLPRRSAGGATQVWIDGDSLSKFFSPGAFVSGSIIVGRHKNSPAVPRTAIVKDEKGMPFLFRKTENGFEKISVSLGEADGDLIEVIGGVDPSDEIVVHGAYELFHRDFSRTFKVSD